jgi:hypothetical protein
MQAEKAKNALERPISPASRGASAYAIEKYRYSGIYTEQGIRKLEYSGGHFSGFHQTS